jgi:hypothetical protein
MQLSSTFVGPPDNRGSASMFGFLRRCQAFGKPSKRQREVQQQQEQPRASQIRWRTDSCSSTPPCDEAQSRARNYLSSTTSAERYEEEGLKREPRQKQQEGDQLEREARQK